MISDSQVFCRAMVVHWMFETLGTVNKTMKKLDFSIRSATKEDAAFIRRLIWQVGINPLGLDWRRFVVAVHANGTRLGCVQLKVHKDGSSELASLAVLPLYRQQRVAEALIRTILIDLNPPVFLTCRGSLVSCYERFGFQEISDVNSMPVYFRRIKRIFTWLEKRKWVEHLVVMIWDTE